MHLPVDVLHVIPQLSSGGASRALTALIGGASTANHRVVSMISATTSGRGELSLSGIDLIEQPNHFELHSLVTHSDIVHVHFWNTPELYAFMALPILARVVVWSLVAGDTAPHMVTPEIASYADLLVSSGRPFTDLCERDLVIKPRTPHRISRERRPVRVSRPFTVGIFGTLDSSRSEVGAFDLFVAADLTHARLLVVGVGDLPPIWRARAEALKMLDQVEFTGYVQDIDFQLKRMDVLLHMPRKDSYATSDLSVQEALMAGVVPVVKSGTPVAELVRDNIDSLVAIDDKECVRHLQTLYKDPHLVQRLSTEGVESSHVKCNPTTCAKEFETLYAELMELPKRPHKVSMHGATTGAYLFMATLGSKAEVFRISATRGAGWQDADEVIASSPPALVGAGAGGILHYRGYYPSDPILRYWAGLVFAAKGRTALAAAEFSAAAKMGFSAADNRLTALVNGPRAAYRSHLQRSN
jgi:glycosyltransferase involved in cell wall biosynthesis